MSIVDFFVAVFLVLGAVVMMLSSLGVLRFGDVFLRMHAQTKSSTLGIGCIAVAVALYFSDPLITVKLIALAVIYFLTAPVAAQVLAHAAHVSKVPVVKEMWVDDLAASHITDLDAVDEPSED